MPFFLAAQTKFVYEFDGLIIRTPFLLLICNSSGSQKSTPSYFLTPTMIFINIIWLGGNIVRFRRQTVNFCRSDRKLPRQ